MSRPIEEGCLAIIAKGCRFDSPNLGKVVRVGRFIGRHPEYVHVDLWEVDQEISWRKTFGRIEDSHLCPESALERIDEDDTETTTATTDTPAEVGV